MAEPIRRNPADAVRLGTRARPLSDLYYDLMRRPWRWLIAFLAAVFVLANLSFALLYSLQPDGFHGSDHIGFREAFDFSVQTFATIGYGALSPKTMYTNLLVTAEALAGIIYSAIATGLVFSKFSRPSARVLFSEPMVITRRNGRRYLQFRLANARGNELVEASLRVTMLKTETTTEGHSMRRLYEMKLDRAMTPLFTLSWLVMHEIDEHSPMFGEDAASLEDDEALFIVTLTGIDSTFAQTVHARRFYEFHDIRWDHHFVDIISPHPSGQLQMDLGKFHDIVPDAIEGSVNSDE